MNTTVLHLDIEGMGCGSCVSHVRAALAKVPGVRVDDVWVGGAVVSAPSSVPSIALREAVAEAGYTLKGVRDEQR